MKRPMTAFVVALCAACGYCEWTYDGSAKTISDSEHGWVLECERSGDSLTLKGVKVSPESPSPIDLSDVKGLGDCQIRSMKHMAFANNAKISAFVFPETLTAPSGSQHFENCRNLASVRLPANLASFGVKMFSGCSALRTVEPLVPAGAALNSQVFYGCPVEGRAMITNASVARYENLFFYDHCLRSITLGTGVANLGKDNVSTRNTDASGRPRFELFLSGRFPTTDGNNCANSTGSRLRFYYPFFDTTWTDPTAGGLAQRPIFSPVSEAQLDAYKADYGDNAVLPTHVVTGSWCNAQGIWLIPWMPDEISDPALVTDTLKVAHSLQDWAVGDVTPRYGYVTTERGATVTGSASESGLWPHDNEVYACVGYRLDKLTANGWAEVTAERNARVFSYVNDDGAARRITWLWEPAGVALTAAYDTPKGRVEVSPAPNAVGGSYRKGTAVTLTCVPAEGATFAGWTGNLDGVADATSRVITVIMDRSRKILPALSVPWSVSKVIDWNTVAITDGEWTLKCSGYNSGKGTSLRVTACETASEGGFLDLSQPIAGLPDAAVTQLHEHTFLRQPALSFVKLCPRTTDIGHNVFKDCRNLTRVEPLLPTSVKSVGNSAFSGTSLAADRLVLPCNCGSSAFSSALVRLGEVEVLEGVTSLTGDSLFQNVTSVTNMVLPSTLTTVGNIRIGGTIRLEPAFPKSLTSISSDGFKLAFIANEEIELVPKEKAFLGWTGEHPLGGPNYGGNPHVKAVTLWTQSLGARMFQGWTALETVNFVGEELPTFRHSMFANLPAKTVRVFYPADSAAWTAAVAGDFAGVAEVSGCRDLTDDEKAAYRAAYPGERMAVKVVTFRISEGQWLVPKSKGAGLRILVR